MTVESYVIRVEYPPRLMTREMAAYYLSIPLRTIDELTKMREITAHKASGTRSMFKREDLDAWADRIPEKLPASLR